MRKIAIVDRLKSDKKYRIFIFIVLLMAGFLLIFLLNNVTSHFEPGTWLYRDARIFPTYPPAGNDFRVGYYRPAINLVESHFTSIGPNGEYSSFYPPLVALFNLPYVLFDIKTAYVIHVVMLILANLACLFMATMLVRRYLLGELSIDNLVLNTISVFLFFMVAFFVFSSYFFLYSIERGNTDILVMFYCMLTIWTMIKYPKKIWIQVIFLSVAVNYKIYPIILFTLLLFKHGKKLIFPALFVNIIFLFCLGPKMALGFIHSVTAGGAGAGIGNAYSSVANHAAYSFTIGIDKSGGEYLSGTFFLIWAIALLVPLLIWGITTIGIVLKKYSTTNAILFFMVSVPLMSLLPTISIDYKLVIFGVVVILLLGLVFKQFLQQFSWFDSIQVIILFGILLMLSRSYAFIDKSMPLISNKYIWVLLLEVFISINVLRNQKKCYQLEDSDIVSAV